MRTQKILKRVLLGASVLLAGGTVLSNGCMNTLASINVCGTVLTFCTPGDQLRLFWPYLEIPDYTADPSCTIPLGCVGSGLFDPVDPNNPLDGPGGGSSAPPSNNQGGGLGGGGGGGGGV